MPQSERFRCPNKNKTAMHATAAIVMLSLAASHTGFPQNAHAAAMGTTTSGCRLPGSDLAVQPTMSQQCGAVMRGEERRRREERKDVGE